MWVSLNIYLESPLRGSAMESTPTSFSHWPIWRFTEGRSLWGLLINAQLTRGCHIVFLLDTGRRGVGQESRAMASRVMARVPSPTGGAQSQDQDQDDHMIHDDAMIQWWSWKLRCMYDNVWQCFVILQVDMLGYCAMCNI